MRLFGLGKPRSFEFVCADCGDVHRGSPSFAFPAPPHVGDLSLEEQKQRVELSDDTCVIRSASEDQEAAYFVRGVLEVPIASAEEPFTWGVWVSQSAESFERYVATFGSDQSGDSSFAWLAVAWSPYRRPTADGYLESLACTAHWQGEGMRPLIEVHECDHPLYVDQCQGIPWKRAVEIARLQMHGDAAQK